MHELPVEPLVRLAAEIFDFVEPLDRAAELQHDVVLLVEQGHAGLELRHHQQVLPGVDVGRQAEARERFLVDAVHREDLQRVVGAVGHDDRRLAGRAVGCWPPVDPEAVCRVERALAVARTAEGAHPLRILVEPVDLERAVAVDEQEAAVVEKCKVGGKKTLPGPIRLGRHVFARGIRPRFHRRLLEPDDLPLGRQFRESLHALVAADVEKLLVALLADLDSVAAPLEFAAEAANEFSGGIEDEDRGVILLVLVPLVDHVEIARGVDGDVVRGLPGVFVGELREVVADAKGVAALADDRFIAEPAGSGLGWLRGEGRGRDGRHAGEGAAGEIGVGRLLRHDSLLKLLADGLTPLRYYVARGRVISAGITHWSYCSGVT